MGVCFVPMFLQLDVFVEFATNKVTYCKIFIKIFKYKIVFFVLLFMVVLMSCDCLCCCVVMFLLLLLLLCFCCCVIVFVIVVFVAVVTGVVSGDDVDVFVVGIFVLFASWEPSSPTFTVFLVHRTVQRRMPG